MIIDAADKCQIYFSLSAPTPPPPSNCRYQHRLKPLFSTFPAQTRGEIRGEKEGESETEHPSKFLGTLNLKDYTAYRKNKAARFNMQQSPMSRGDECLRTMPLERTGPNDSARTMCAIQLVLMSAVETLYLLRSRSARRAFVCSTYV
jgi:hypothetical protein